MWDAIVIILDIVVIVGALYNHYRSESLDEREEELDKYSVHLDERANKLSQWEQELIEWEKEKNNEKGLA